MRCLLRSAFAVALFFVSSLASSPIGAADLSLRVDGQAEYDDNAFRNEDNQDDDFLFRVSPSVRVHEDRGEDARWSLQYVVPFEFAVDNGDELNDIDHIGEGRVTYHVNDRVEAFASGSVRYLRSGLRQVEVSDPSAAGSQRLNTERERVLISNAQTGFSYSFSPRLASTVRLGWDFFDPERSDRARNHLLSSSALLNYVLSPKHSVGGGVVFSFQDFDDRVNIQASQTLSYGARVSWQYRFDETTSFSVNVGPSLLQTDQEDAAALLTGQALIPFADVSGTVLGKVDGDGAPVTAPVADGSIVVGNAAVCAFTNVGGACPFDIALDAARYGMPGSGGLIDQIRGATANIQNLDPDGVSDTSLNVFGEITLRKDWSPNLSSALQYSRQQGGASGLGGAVIQDSLSFSNTWEPSEKWQFTARADWSLRESIFELSQVLTLAQEVDTNAQFGTPTGAAIAGVAVAPGGTGNTLTLRGTESQIDTMRWGIAGRATHRFSRNTSAHVQLTYNQQESEGGTLGNASDFENFLALVGVRYVFDPIKLW